MASEKRKVILMTSKCPKRTLKHVNILSCYLQHNADLPTIVEVGPQQGREKQTSFLRNMDRAPERPLVYETNTGGHFIMTRLKTHQRSETYTPTAILTTEGGIGNKRASYVAPAGQGVPPIPSADDGTSVFCPEISVYTVPTSLTG